MLEILRRYQKILFVGITLVVILSFSFFGTYSAMIPTGGKRKDPTIATAIDGSKIQESELKTLSYLLNQSSSLHPQNILSLDTVEKWFLESGIALLLFSKNAEAYAPEWGKKQAKIHRYIPYSARHPSLTAEKLWEVYAPKINQYLSSLKEQFSLSDYIQLYLAEKHFPPYRLKQMLAYQMLQQGEAFYDPSLGQRDLSLFGYKDLKDWFSPQFLEEVALFLLQGASFAKKEGYTVSNLQAKQEVLSHIQKKYPHEKAEKLFYQQLRSWGVDASTFLSLWKKVVLFQQWFEGTAQALFLDQESLSELKQASFQRAYVKRWQLIPELRTKDAYEKAQVQMYVEQVAAKEDFLVHPTYKSATQVEKTFPELTYHTYKIRWAKVSKEEATLKIPAQKLLDWQLKEPQWKTLCLQFPKDLSLQPTEEDRFSFLEKLPKEKKALVDKYTREQILQGTKDWAKQALTHKRKKEEVIRISGKGFLLFPEMKQAFSLVSVLKNLSPGEVSYYQASPEIVYEIELIEKSEEPKLFTLSESLRWHLLQGRIDQKLQEEYPSFQKSHPSLFKEGKGYKPYEEAKQELARLAFSKESFFQPDLLTASISSYYEKCIAENPPPEKPFFLEEGYEWIDSQHKDFARVSSLEEKQFSLLLPEEGAASSFFQVIQKHYQSDLPGSVKKNLQREIQYQLAEKLLSLCSKS